MDKLAIIIVTWNSAGFIEANLDSLEKALKDIDASVWVVDNASSDNTAALVAQKYPWVNLIANNQNLGFAKANNLAIKSVDAEYYLLFNPDMRAQEDTFTKLLAFMDTHPEAGVGGCKLIDQNGQIVPHVRNFPTLWDQLAVLLKIPHIFPGVLNAYLQKEFDYSQEAVVDSIRGSLFCMRRELIERLGGLDERYFIWFEEVDFCKEVYKAGMKVMYTPTAVATDYVGKSFSLVARYKKQKMFSSSMNKYFYKWHGWVAGAIIWAVRLKVLTLVWLVEKLTTRKV
jgi:GT2 family glycosyltransferase